MTRRQISTLGQGDAVHYLAAVLEKNEENYVIPRKMLVQILEEAHHARDLQHTIQDQIKLNQSPQKELQAIAGVLTRVANGDLSKRLPIHPEETDTDMASVTSAINTMTDQLQTLGNEISKVAIDVGTEGILGSQAQIPNANGIWKEITENFNTMASNLTLEVHEIATVAEAVAHGDLCQKIKKPAKGETLQLHQTINTMVDALRTFAQEVTWFIHGAGTPSMFYPQRRAEGVEGTWRDMMDKVDNLTSQIRAFIDITDAALSGDFTELNTTNPSGEMDGLNQNVKKMISILQESVQRNNTSKEVAELASRSRSEFLADRSHEIQTPLGGIIGMAQAALEMEDLQPSVHQTLTVVHNLGASLLRTINDVLELSKIEAHRIVMESVPFSLSTTVFGALRTLGIEANAKTITLVYEIDEYVPDYIIGDPFRLRQVVLDLVGNAVKFIEHGEIRVALGKACDKVCTADNYAFEISVSVNGVGLAVDKLDVIFDKFEQADASVIERFGATGLGLALTKCIAQLICGDIRVTSRIGEGSLLRFTWVAKLAEPSPGQFTRDKTGRVLFVTEGNSKPQLIVQLLEELNFLPQVVSVENLLTTLSSGTGLFDAILVETVETASFLKSSNALKVIPVILVAPRVSLDLKSTLDLNIISCIPTPCHPVDLWNGILPALGNRPTRIATESTRPLVVLLAEDNLVNQKLVTKILERAGHAVTVVENGREALEVFKQRRFDIILMDAQMPVMGGYEATIEIRKYEEANQLPRTPIIALIAHAKFGHDGKCRESGMDDYLSKPFNRNCVLQTVHKYGSLSDARQ